MEKVKVLHVIGGLNVGGAEIVATNLYRQINRGKYEFHYIVFGDEIGYFEKEIEYLGGKIIHIEKRSKNYFQYMFNLWNVIKKEHYEVIHSHTLLNSGLVLLIARLSKIPVRVAHAHSIKSWIHENNVKKVYSLIMKILIKWNANRYLACSVDAGKYLYGESFFMKNGIVFHNGINLNEFKFSRTTRKQIRNKLNAENKLILGNVGRLSKVKNQKFIIDILKSILETEENILLLFIGDGEEAKDLKKHVKDNNLEDNVLFIGNVNKVSSYYNAMDIFIFPSLYEGLGMSLIEAQANGLPSIISERIPREAILTNQVEILNLNSDVKAWKEKILNLKRTQQEKVDKNLYLHGYDINDMGRNIEEIYNL